MKLDRDIWKTHLQSIKNEKMTTIIEFMNVFRMWKLAHGHEDAEDEEEEEIASLISGYFMFFS